MKKFLAFGSGFLVRYISREFLENGSDVRVVYNRHSIPDLEARYQLQGDSFDVIDLLNGYQPDCILFAWGDSFVGHNVDIQQAISKNLMQTLFVLDIIHREFKQLGFIKKIVIIGSAAEYGKQYTFPIPENMETHAKSIYGLTKIFLYNTSKYYVEKGLPIIYTRQFNAVGPHQREVFVLASFSKQIALIEKGLQAPKIEVGNLEAQRDFIDIRDAARAYFHLFLKGIIGETYNIGSGKAAKIQFLLDTLISLTTFDANLIHIEQSKTLSLQQNTLGDILLSDNSKLTGLGFSLRYSLEETIKDTLNYWRSHV